MCTIDDSVSKIKNSHLILHKSHSQLQNMGNSTIKSQLRSYIDTDKQDKVIALLKQHPKFTNESLDSSNHTALLRAVWKSNYTIVNILLGQFKADPNIFGGKYTPLMLAAIRGNISILDLLVYFKAQIGTINQEGLNAIDIAVLFGQYDAALFLKMKAIESLQPGKQKGNSLSVHYKRVWQAFENRNQKMKLPFNVNYKAFLECLDQDYTKEAAQPLICMKSKEKTKRITGKENLLQSTMNQKASSAQISGNYKCRKETEKFQKATYISQNYSLNMTMFLNQSMALGDDVAEPQQNTPQIYTECFKKKYSQGVRQGSMKCGSLHQ